MASDFAMVFGLTGLKKSRPAFCATEIGDRAEAIRKAVGLLKSGDTLIVAGKGHEEGQTIGSVTLPFSDHAELRKALEDLKS